MRQSAASVFLYPHEGLFQDSNEFALVGERCAVFLLPHEKVKTVVSMVKTVVSMVNDDEPAADILQKDATCVRWCCLMLSSALSELSPHALTCLLRTPARRVIDYSLVTGALRE